MSDLWLIDAFTDAPFRGNPAGVCWLDAPADDEWMQHVALEMNQAETAFLRAEGEHVRLRWFTPASEVDLCGHATLASAHYLWTTGRLPAGRTAVFETRSGRLTATRGDAGAITLDFPATPPSPVPAPDGLLRALGVADGRTLSNRLAQPDLLVRVADARTVRALAPDMRALKTIEARGVIATAPGDEAGVDFVSRFFAPRFGVDEDPVTGSAHCTLGPYWSAELARTSLVGYQASPRGGTVGVEVAGGRVRLTGQAVVVVRGTIDAASGTLR